MSIDKKTPLKSHITWYSKYQLPGLPDGSQSLNLHKSSEIFHISYHQAGYASICVELIKQQQNNKKIKDYYFLR